MLFQPYKLEILRKEREKRLSMQRLINEAGLGISIQTYRNYAEGRTVPDAEHIAKIALYYNVPVSYFFVNRLN